MNVIDATEIYGDGPSGGLADDGELPALPALGAAIGRYAVTGVLGRGGMGIVLAARDPELARNVAIKLLHPAAWPGDSAIAGARLEREAQAMAQLSHPNVVTVYEAGRFDGHPFIAMELVEGETLRGWLERPHGWRTVVAMFVAAGRGLAAAHAVGLVHRDFKPENVLLGRDGRPRVSDFGLVVSNTERGAPLALGSGAGTPNYMAPEQWLGATVGEAADQFAFAVALWEALWGVRPFAGDSRSELFERVAAGQLAPIPARRGVPRRIEAALRRALAMRPADRWPSLATLLGELERRARDRRPLVAAGVAAAVLIGAMVVVARRAPPVAPSPCRAAAAGLDAAWSPARQGALAQGFAALPGGAAQAWAAAAQRLDAWAGAHRTLRIETCELARTRQPGVIQIAAARAACLDRRLGDLDALLTTLATPDATMAHYVRSAASGLPRPADCLDDRPRDAGPAGDAAAIAEVRAALSRAAALRSLGKPREAVAIATPAAATADRLGGAQLIAEAQQELGLCYQVNGVNDAAGLALQRAAWNADRSEDDELRFDATLGLVRASIDHSEYVEARRRLETAKMIGARLGGDSPRLARLAAQEAALAYWRGAYRECVAVGRAAIAPVEQALGPLSISAAQVRANLARCLTKLDRGAEVEPLLTRALEISEATAGREHPQTAELLSNLGTLARTEGRLDDAMRYFADSLAIRERIFGADNPEVASVLNNLANAQRDAGRYPEARATIDRALAIWERAWGATSPAIAVSATVAGNIELERGDPAAALVRFERALAIRRLKRPDGHDEILKSLLNIGRAQLALRQRAAVATLEQAHAGYLRNADTDAGTRAEVRFYLGRARFELAGDRAGGLALITGACAELTGHALRHERAACDRYGR